MLWPGRLLLEIKPLHVSGNFFLIFVGHGGHSAVIQTYMSVLQAATDLVAMASEKIATKFYEQVANLATGAVEKADCSSTGFFSNIITKPNKFTVKLSEAYPSRLH